MEALLEAFGIDGRLIIIQIFNFAVLAGLLWYFLYEPVLKILDERKRTIEKGIADARAAEELKAHADEERSRIVSGAQKEAEEVVERARVHADEKVATVLHDASGKAENIVRDAEKRGADIIASSKKESEAEIAKLAMLAAEKILKAQ